MDSKGGVIYFLCCEYVLLEHAARQSISCLFMVFDLPFMGVMAFESV